VADEPKPESKKDKSAQAADKPSATSTSPAPAEVADGAKPPAGKTDQRVIAEPLSDGTVPTVLAPGQTKHQPEPKGKASISSIYRRADILTTLLTFGGAVIAGTLILGAYWFFTQRTAKPTSTPTKVTNLDKAEVDKLESFFGGNSAGHSAEILTISSSSLFKNRVAVASDLKVVGGVEVSGTTTLGDLNVDKTSTLGVTNVRGQLTVNGPLTVQSPTLFNAGGSFKGNLAVTGNGTFGGSISAGTLDVATLSVNGVLNVNGHLNIGGQQPTAAANAAAGSGAAANVSGNDAAGTVNVTAGAVAPNGGLGGELVKVTFHNTYPSVPTIVISPNNRNSALLEAYVIKSANWFIIATSKDASSTASYSFDYWIIQ
jgi:hypothetical protein